MMTRRNAVLSLLGLGLMAAGCGGVTPPQTPSGPAVTVNILSVTLANDCTTSATAPADCASSDAGTGLVGGCGGLCRQTSMQLLFVADSGTGSADVAVTRVRLLDDTTGAPAATLSSRDPQAWNDLRSRYETWDETVNYGASTRAMYKLSSPDWNSVGTATDRFAYQRRFVLEVTVTINGVARTVRSAPAMREPEIVT